MKKILIVLLCLLCLVAFCACGDSDLKEFVATLSSAEASSATADITYTIVGETEADSIVLQSTATLYESTKTPGELVVPYFAPVTTNASGRVILPDNTTEETSAANALAAGLERISFSQLVFNKKYFLGGKYIANDTGFEATVSNVSAFFGIETGISQAKVTITLKNGGLPRKMSVSYDTELGNTVEIVITYGYS